MKVVSLILPVLFPGGFSVAVVVVTVLGLMLLLDFGSDLIVVVQLKLLSFS